MMIRNLVFIRKCTCSNVEIKFSTVNQQSIPRTDLFYHVIIYQININVFCNNNLIYFKERYYILLEVQKSFSKLATVPAVLSNMEKLRRL